MFKFEIHLHTADCSACAVSTGKEMVDAAVEKGYSGFVITNHFYNGNTFINREKPWEDFVDAYAKDYEETKKYAGDNNLTVLFGIEEVYERGKEMLIYGISPETLKSCPEFKNMTAKEKSEFVHKNGGICIAAHPFRNRPYIPNPDKEPDPQLFDAIEGYNYFNKENENIRAFEFAEKHNLIATSGGDIHHAENFGFAGIAFKEKITNDREFIENLLSGNFQLIIP